MLTLDNISFEFGGRFLYRDSTLQIMPGDHAALIGRNGTGKTTLLRLITGQFTPTAGRLTFARGIKIGFLDQDLQSQVSDKTVLQVAMEAFDEALRLHAEVEALLARMQHDHAEALVTELAEKQQRIEALGGYALEPKAAEILAGLGFSDTDIHMPFSTFSGGWRMRVMLAKILLQEPDLLLLDEPTNHLDLPSIQWLETYLRNFRGAFLMVSHDRFFLDRLTDMTIEIDRGKFTVYKGNYTHYLQQKEEREEILARQYENQQKLIEDTEKFINRFRAKATKAKQVQSRVKMLDRMDLVDAPADDAPTVNFEFQPDTVPGRTIVEMDLAGKSYGDKRVLEHSRLSILRGDKIALIGANGIGKSTLLRMVHGSEPFEGSLTPGHQVKPAFFAQHQLEALKGTNTILEEMDGFIRKKGEAFVRGILGGFLFTGDDVFKKISVLSGGEKSRVALAKTLLSDANFLLLDEPTNHLDIQSVEILVEALRAYEGTFIVVSHDRFFLREVANKIWFIEDRRLNEYPGTYEDYEYHQQQKALAAAEARNTAEKKADTPVSTGKLSYQEQKEQKARQQRIQRELEKAETLVMTLETEKESLLAEMAQPEVASDFSRLSDKQRLLQDLEARLAAALADWERCMEQAETLNG